MRAMYSSVKLSLSRAPDVSAFFNSCAAEELKPGEFYRNVGDFLPGLLIVEHPLNRDAIGRASCGAAAGHTAVGVATETEAKA